MEPNQTLSMTLEGSTTGRSCRHAERKFAEHVKSCLLNLNPDFSGPKPQKRKPQQYKNIHDHGVCVNMHAIPHVFLGEGGFKKEIFLLLKFRFSILLLS